MARKASSKPDSGSPSTSPIGFWTNPTSFGIRHSGFVITPARRLAIMNLAIRGIEADIGMEHADTFRRDLHPALRA